MFKLANVLARPALNGVRCFAYKPSAAEVKKLRELTGSPMMDCMKALAQTEGNLEESKEFLRKKGLAYADKRADRDATQGLVGLSKAASHVTMVQFACETDFVAKTDQFRAGLEAIMDTFHSKSDVHVSRSQSNDTAFMEKLAKDTQLKKPLDDAVPSQNIEDGVKFVISKTQENCQMAKVFQAAWNEQNGQVCATYLHNRSADHIGKIGSVFVSFPKT